MPIYYLRRSPMPAFSSLCASVLLAACGGGGDANIDTTTASSTGSSESTLAAYTVTRASDWTRCATEYGKCTFSGTRQVRYGLNGNWLYRTATGSIGCNNEVFGGDPAPNASKVCDFTNSVTTAPAPVPTPTPAPAPAPAPTTWTRCATEYGTCSFSGTRQVRYGLNTMWLYQTATGSIGCNSNVFGGDPVPNATKVCDFADTVTSTPAPTPAPAPAPVGATITDIKVENTSAAQQTNVPITFGQVFVPGALAATDTLVGKLSDGTNIALQVDAKAKHADGSLRHAVISGIVPKLSASQTLTIALAKGSASAAASAVSPTALLNAGFNASVNLTVGGQVYTASADSLLKSAYTTWLSGPVAGEWLVSAPLKNTQGVSHPHLTARFAIRSYSNLNKARVDVTIENDWAYESSPQNYTYDVQVLVGGQTVYSKTALKHFHHARWHNQFWWGAAPAAHIRHNSAYLMASKAVPNYDQGIQISESGLTSLNNSWAASNNGPMGPGIVNPAMPTAGGRPDIGPLPQWAAMYLLSMDRRAKSVTLGTGDLAGSWPIHYRDKKTDRPVSIADYPYMTLLGNPSDTVNPATGKSEAFPVCGGDCSTTPYNYNPDGAHQPSFAYVPYLTTGDYFYLEELQFWANWNLIRYNPYYRNLAKGTLQADEVRAQAWSLRTLGQAAYITPDTDPMKPYFVDRVNNNLTWYNTTYTNASPNKLGVIDGSGQYAFAAVLYPTGAGAQTGVAPWQDDFFTWSVGYLADLGFTNATPLLKWKATFPVARINAPGFCWIDGAAYALAVRPNSGSSPYSTFAEVYQASMRNSDGTAMTNSTGAAYLSQPCNSQAQANWRTQKDKDMGVNRSPWLVGEMDGWATLTSGYPSNMQPALAVAATYGVPNAQAAWNTFINRPVKPDYSVEPQWAIVPRY